MHSLFVFGCIQLATEVLFPAPIIAMNFHTVFSVLYHCHHQSSQQKRIVHQSLFSLSFGEHAHQIEFPHRFLVWASSHIVVLLAKLHCPHNWGRLITKHIYTVQLWFYRLALQKQLKLQRQLQQKQSPFFLCLSESIQRSKNTHQKLVVIHPS